MDHNSSPRTPASYPVIQASTWLSSLPTPRPRDKLQEKRNALSRSLWALNEADFNQHFGDLAYRSRGFLEELIRFSKVEPDFADAWEWLKAANDKRLAGAVKSGVDAGDTTHIVWTTMDIRQAMTDRDTATNEVRDMEPKKHRRATKTRPGDETNDLKPSANITKTSKTQSSSSFAQPPSQDHLNQPTTAESNVSPSTLSIPSPPERKSRRQAAQDRATPAFTLQTTLVDKVVDIENEDRQEHVADLVRMFTEQTREAIKSGTFSLPEGQTTDGFGLKIGLAVEHALYLEHWGMESQASIQYLERVSLVLKNVQTNPRLRHQILTGTVNPGELAQEVYYDSATRAAVPIQTKKRVRSETADPLQTKDAGHGEKKIKADHVSTSKGNGKAKGLQPEPTKSTRGGDKMTNVNKDDTEPFQPAASDQTGHLTLQEPKTKTLSLRNDSTKAGNDSRDDDNDDDDNHNNDNDLEPTRPKPPQNDLKRIRDLDRIMANYVHPSPSDIAVTYLDTSLLLPPSAPPGWPHLIDLSNLSPNDTTGLTIADMVVTLLHNHSPETLARFMDMSHDYSFRVKEPPGATVQDFVVVRRGVIVSCGFIDEGNWSIKHKYSLRATPMALWTPLCVETSSGIDNADIERVTDVVEMMVAGEALAFEVLEGKGWVPGKGGRVNVRNTCAWRH